jgi:hypothetical protein
MLSGRRRALQILVVGAPASAQIETPEHSDAA